MIIVLRMVMIQIHWLLILELIMLAESIMKMEDPEEPTKSEYYFGLQKDLKKE